MRNPRAKDSPAETDAYYHLITRTVAGEFLFPDVEKEMLRKHLWLVAERCGIDVITNTVMTNHLHIVVYAPKRKPLPDAELLRRYALLHRGCSEWDERELDEIRDMLDANGDEAAEWRARELGKMGDISAYMKLLKQRYFDAVAASRRWRVSTGRRLSKMTFAQQQEYLRRATAELFAERKRKRRAA